MVRSKGTVGLDNLLEVDAEDVVDDDFEVVDADMARAGGAPRLCSLLVSIFHPNPINSFNEAMTALTISLARCIRLASERSDDGESGKPFLGLLPSFVACRETDTPVDVNFNLLLDAVERVDFDSGSPSNTTSLCTIEASHEAEALIASTIASSFSLDAPPFEEAPLLLESLIFLPLATLLVTGRALTSGRGTAVFLGIVVVPRAVPAEETVLTGITRRKPRYQVKSRSRSRSRRNKF